MWTELLQKNITSIADLSDKLKLSPLSLEELEQVTRRFPMSITPYYLSLIDWEDEQDPIRNMCIPSLQEQNMTGAFDTSGEATNTKLTGIQHKYRQTALILSTSQCAMYCRHCFRKRVVGISDEEINANFDQVADYVRSHKEISNVLISGGDSFLMTDEWIEQYLATYSAMEHLDLIRFGTRTPVTFPERILSDDHLLEILEKYQQRKQIFVVTHFNHPREITRQSAAAVERLRKCGIVVRNQTVLLRGVNDDGEVLGQLCKNLTSIGVAPYYIFQCRPVSGVGVHFQVPLEKGYQIVEKAKSMQSGMGKCMRYIISHVTGKIEPLYLEEDNTMCFKYHQAKAEKDIGRVFKRKLEPGQTWL
ncbi:MAG: KamA family radical SAM protein [Lachnospiraceae bacterium]|nr:KamA family radical SAM protein [Lachnospiraceae bacterium]